MQFVPPLQTVRWPLQSHDVEVLPDRDILERRPGTSEDGQPHRAGTTGNEIPVRHIRLADDLMHWGDGTSIPVFPIVPAPTVYLSPSPRSWRLVGPPCPGCSHGSPPRWGSRLRSSAWAACSFQRWPPAPPGCPVCRTSGCSPPRSPRSAKYLPPSREPTRPTASPARRSPDRARSPRLRRAGSGAVSHAAVREAVSLNHAGRLILRNASVSIGTGHVAGLDEHPRSRRPREAAASTCDCGSHRGRSRHGALDESEKRAAVVGALLLADRSSHQRADQLTAALGVKQTRRLTGAGDCFARPTVLSR